MQNGITLAMIVLPDAKEAQKLDRCLASVKQHVDEIVIVQAGTAPSDDVERVAANYGAQTYFFKWCDDFAAARAFAFSKATKEWVLWLDADDILVGGEKLHSYLSLAEEKKIDGFGLMYHYGYDKDGNLTEKHWKTQMIRNDGHAEWRGAIHEDLIPLRSANWVKIYDVIRVHKSTKEDNAGHSERNLAILEKEIAKNPAEPRNYFYLARCLLGLERFEDTINAVANYLDRSGWDQERYEARLVAGEAFMKLGDTQSAIESYQAAILEYENAPDAYILKARIYITEERWKEALTNLELAGMLKGKGMIVENPTLLTRDLPALASLCLIHLKRFDEAQRMAQIALKGGKSPEIEDLYKTAKKLTEWENLAETYYKLGTYLFEQDDIKGLQKLVASVPKDIVDDPRIVRLHHSAVEPRVWPHKSIAFYCGPSLESWDGNSVNNGGIGGSETAVIELAKRFAQAGWESVVYNWCDAPAEGMLIDGVRYINYWQVDIRDTFDVLSIWRSPQYLDLDWKARKLIVDMHDVSNALEWTPDRLAKVDHVFVKSQYHKSLYTIPEEKVVVVGNGIDLKRFETKIPKEPYRFVYTSTPNRGLENILDVWSDIRKELPDAELHVYYGWNSFYESHKREPVMMDWMQSMEEKMKQPGIVYHGRVGQAELARDLMASSLWLYPTEFPEIHCITALEMQAAGVYPITTGFAALEETQAGGVKLAGDPKTPEWRAQFIEEVVKAAKGKKDLAPGYKKAQDSTWDNVAHIWQTTLQ